MLLEPTLQKLRSLRLHGIVTALEQQLAQPEFHTYAPNNPTYKLCKLTDNLACAKWCPFFFVILCRSKRYPTFFSPMPFAHR
jgi:hypothetical protein